MLEPPRRLSRLLSGKQPIVAAVVDGACVCRSPHIFVCFPPITMSTKTATQDASVETLETAVATAAAEQGLADDSGKAGNKPLTTIRKNGCAISVYRNVRKSDGEIYYKFTLSRTIKRGDEFKTAYSFRFEDLRPVQSLIAQAKEFVIEAATESLADGKGE